jgi:hypothetical protein
MSRAACQLELPLVRTERTPEELHATLCRHSGRPLGLTITRNRVSLISVRFDAGGAARVRMSRAFLSAPDEVVVALGRYLARRSRDAWQVVGRYASSITPEPGGGRRSRLPTRGRVYDLEAIRDRVNRLHFNGVLRCRVGWGRPGPVRQHARTRTIRYGSYCRARDLVRINPLLDDHRVPAEFVEYIVFHEMLHAVVPSEKGVQRWAHHHETYRVMEQRFPDYPRMRTLAAELVLVLRPRRAMARNPLEPA